MKKAFEFMRENEFIEWVWRIYNNMVQISGMKTRRSLSKKAQNFDETMLLNDSVAQFNTPKGAHIAN